MLIHARQSKQRAEEVVREICSSGGAAEAIFCDLAEEAGQNELIDRAWQWRCGVDVWVNNAGADVLTGEPASWSFERKLQELWRVDVTATLRLSRMIGAKMKERGSGVILNMGWDQAERGMAGDSGELFATTKGAIMAFTRSLARSLAPEVRVHCLAPGWIKTAWGKQASEAWQQRAKSEALLGRWGTPEDVAQVARFLASPVAAFLTGQIVPINGGMR